MKNTDNLQSVKEVLQKYDYTAISEHLRLALQCEPAPMLTIEHCYDEVEGETPPSLRLQGVNVAITGLSVEIDETKVTLSTLQKLMIITLENDKILHGAIKPYDHHLIYEIESIDSKRFFNLHKSMKRIDEMNDSEVVLLEGALTEICHLPPKERFHRETSIRGQESDLRTKWYDEDDEEFKILSRNIEGAFAARSLSYEIKKRIEHGQTQKQILLKSAKLFQITQRAFSAVAHHGHDDKYEVVLAALKNVLPECDLVDDLIIYDGGKNSYTRPFTHIRSKNYWPFSNKGPEQLNAAPFEIVQTFLELLAENNDIQIDYRPEINLIEDSPRDLSKLPLMPEFSQLSAYQDPKTNPERKQMVLTVQNWNNMMSESYLEQQLEYALDLFRVTRFKGFFSQHTVPAQIEFTDDSDDSLESDSSSILTLSSDDHDEVKKMSIDSKSEEPTGDETEIFLHPKIFQSPFLTGESSEVGSIFDSTEGWDTSSDAEEDWYNLNDNQASPIPPTPYPSEESGSGASTPRSKGFGN